MALALVNYMVLCFLEAHSRPLDWLLVVQVASISSQVDTRPFLDDVRLNAQVGKPKRACSEGEEMRTISLAVSNDFAR